MSGLNEALHRVTTGIGEDKSVTRAVIYTIGVSLIITAVTGGVFIGTMRANIDSNQEMILQNRTEFYSRIGEMRAELSQQDERLDDMQKTMIEVSTTVHTIHGDVRSIKGWIDEERRFRERGGNRDDFSGASR